jgi:hypothetical protein
MEVCTTLGMLTPEQAAQLRQAGLTAYNHNLDTSPGGWCCAVCLGGGGGGAAPSSKVNKFLRHKTPRAPPPAGQQQG